MALVGWSGRWPIDRCEAVRGVFGLCRAVVLDGWSTTKLGRRSGGLSPGSAEIVVREPVARRRRPASGIVRMALTP